MARRAATAAFTVIPLDAPICQSTLLSSSLAPVLGKKTKKVKEVKKKPTERKPRLTKRLPSTATKLRKGSRSMSTTSVSSFSSSDSSLVRTPSPSPQPQLQPQLEETDMSWLTQDPMMFNTNFHAPMPQQKPTPQLSSYLPVSEEDPFAFLHMDVPSESMIDVNSFFEFLGPLVPSQESFDVNAFNATPALSFDDLFGTNTLTQHSMPSMPMPFPSFDNGSIDPRLFNTHHFGFENSFIPQYSCKFLFSRESC